FSFAFWMNANEGGDDLQTIVAKDDGGTPAFGLLRAGSNFQWFVGAEAAYQTDSGPILAGENLHIAATYSKSDNETLTLYINGTEIVSESGLPGFDDFAASPLVIGAFNSVFSFSGTLDDMQIYNRLLEAEEITAMFNDPGSVPRGGPPVVEPPEPSGEATAIWVSGVESEAGKEFQDLLRDNGFEVTELLTADPTAEEQALLNAAGVVIVSRKVNSGDYNNATWDEEITAPLILMTGYLSRANRWGWLEGNGLADITPAIITAEAPDHPIFEGLEISDGNTAGWHVAVDRGTSAPTDPIANGGTVIATGDGNLMAAEWEAGAVAAGKRLLFLAGSREADGNGIETAGQYDLTDSGATAFVNAVRYMAGIESTGPIDPTGLAGYWRFDEGAGAVAADSSGLGNDGTIVAPTWVEDAARGTVYQSGGGSYVDFGSALPIIGLDDDFTWSFWVNASETDNNNIVLGNRYMPDGVDFAPREFIKFTPRTFEWHFNGGGENSPADNTLFTVGQWDHNVVVKDGDSLTYYRNGEVIAESTVSGAPVNAQPLYLGGQPNNAGGVAENFQGLFDEVAVFSRALSAEEAAQAYQLGLAGEALVSDDLIGPVGDLAPLTSVSRASDGPFSFTLPEGVRADVEYSQDLISWEVIESGVTGSYEDTDAARNARPVGYYRVRR
ncbi:MAG: LamG domain-containing protein, partial [Verrucomicrobiota bacterium]